MTQLSVPRALLHINWLIAALGATVFLQFALNRGGSDQAIWVAAFFLLLRAIGDADGARALPQRTWLVVALFFFLLVVSWVFHPSQTDVPRTLRVIRFALIVLAVHHVAGQQASLRATWIAALAAAIVLWQFAARHLTGHPYGTFSNPHYLAYFSLLLLPLLALMIWWLRAPHRFLLIPIFLLNIELVFNNFEKPTIPLLGISAAIAAVIWSNTSTRARWSIAAFFVVLGVAVWFWIPATWLSDVGLAAPEGDERVEIWADTWRMISAGHMQSWLVGHGLGTFQEHFPDYAAEQGSLWVSGC